MSIRELDSRIMREVMVKPLSHVSTDGAHCDMCEVFLDAAADDPCVPHYTTDVSVALEAAIRIYKKYSCVRWAVGSARGEYEGKYHAYFVDILGVLIEAFADTPEAAICAAIKALLDEKGSE